MNFTNMTAKDFLSQVRYHMLVQFNYNGKERFGQVESVDVARNLINIGNKSFRIDRMKQRQIVSR